ncbi:hypothetical protein AB1Y20_001729 [Prymnesium parvum]|uniref:Uncharacterized protein n=1 Tax=Prymnesium parvum TaxID=97485 RepID=A0AB34KCI2_PRYPA
MASRRLALALLLLLSSPAEGGAPVFQPSARLSRVAERGDAAEFAVLAASGEDATVLNGLLGTSLPSEAMAGGLHADVCAPLGEGTPTLVCLAASRGSDAVGPAVEAEASEVIAFALADMWFAVLPLAPLQDDAGADRLLLRIFALLDQLPTASDAPPPPPRRVLIFLSGESEEQLDDASASSRLTSRAEALWAQRAPAAPLERQLTLEAVRLPFLRTPPAAKAAVEAGGGAAPPARDDGAAGARLLARLAQTARPDSLVAPPRRVPAALSLAALPLLVRELLSLQQASRRAASTRRGRADAPSAGWCDVSDWEGIVRCARAAEAAGQLARREAARLTEIQAEEINPIKDFSPRLEAVRAQALDRFAQDAARLAPTRPFAAKRVALERELAALQLRLLRAHLARLREDCFESFCAELATTMATSTSYVRAASRLQRRSARQHAAAVRAAVPTALRHHRPALERQSVRVLKRRLLGEISLHEAEATELPPPADDVGPPAWWRQIVSQLIGIAFNLAQAYLLQYLPARRRDLADERAMPRGPLF